MKVKTLLCALAASGAFAVPASADEVGVGYCYTSIYGNGNRICRMVATSDLARFTYSKNTTCGSATVTWTVLTNSQTASGSWDIPTIPGQVYELKLTQCSSSGSSSATLWSH